MNNSIINLSQKNKVALITDISYNISGLFLYSDLIYSYIDMIKKKYNYIIPIKYMFGSPQLLWNGGRFILNRHNNTYSLDEIKKELSNAISRNITPLIVASNHLLTEKDLFDKKYNAVFKYLDKNKGGAIVTSDLLKTYIHENYPNVEIHASVIITTLTPVRDKSFYTELSKNYTSFVIHPDDNFNIDLLKQINTTNAEIILNESCFFNCQSRKKHYDTIVRKQFEQCNNVNVETQSLCSSLLTIKHNESPLRTIALSVPEFKTIHSLGFSLFKLQGRTSNIYSFFFDLLRYTLKNNIVFPNNYITFISYIEHYLNSIKQ